MAKVLIADNVSPTCERILSEGGIEVVNRGKLTEEETIAAIAGCQGLVVRSGLQVTAKIIEAASSLQVIGRAGVGTDNIDKVAATQHGVIVMNAPHGNITSAAEHAFALLLAAARSIGPADRTMREGRWDRKKFVGVELEGKTLGIVGLGKVGSQLARYGRAFNMRIIGFDPFLSAERAKVLGVEVVDFDDLLERADFVSVHAALTDETRGMFNARAFRRMKRTARIINTSRGPVIDEVALVDALRNKEIAGAAIDVFAEEPPAEDHPLRGLDNALLTPHLGASTAEAQIKVAEDIAHQFVEFFQTGAVRNAVNMRGLDDPSVRPFLRLAKDLGALGAQLGGEQIRAVEAIYRGELGQFDTTAVTSAAACGALGTRFGDEVNTINARHFAEQKGVEVHEDAKRDAGSYKSLVTVSVSTDQGTHTVSGTVFEGGTLRMVKIDDYRIDLRPAKHMMLAVYADRPGMVGKLGTILGKHEVNIAGMEVGRSEPGKQAMVVLTLDHPVTDEILGEIQTEIGVERIHSITLP